VHQLATLYLYFPTQKVANHNASLDDFTCLLIFPKSILSLLPSRENRGALSAGSIIRDKLRRRVEGEEMAFFEEAAGTARSRVQPTGLPALDEARLRRARGLKCQGAFRKAAQALSSAPQAPKGEATVSLLQPLYPPPTQGPKPDRAHLYSPLTLNAEDIQASLRIFLKGSAPGASALRHSHIEGMITAPSPQAAATALEALVSLENTLASGRAPSSFATWLCGALLTALAKPNRSVRPIAVGELIRRLVAKCLMARAKQSAQALLAPCKWESQCRAVPRPSYAQHADSYSTMLPRHLTRIGHSSRLLFQMLLIW
jgi:hypothetical protein